MMQKLPEPLLITFKVTVNFFKLKFNSREGKPVLITLFTFLLVAALFFSFKIHFNVSDSVDGFFYIKKSDGFKKGDYIVLCPRSFSFVKDYYLDKVAGHGSCGGSKSLLKRVVAGEGDYYSLSGDGVYINGVLQPNSARIDPKFSVIPLPTAVINGVVTKNHVLILGDTPNSYDSRYYGVVSTEWIDYSVTKLF